MSLLTDTSALQTRPSTLNIFAGALGAKPGFSVAVVPKANAPKKPVEDLTIHAAERVEQAMDVVRSLA